jgi:hypothetical protein
MPDVDTRLGGSKTRLTASYTWGQQGLEMHFRDVYQPGQGIFSPGYPLAPLEPERVRVWDYPVGVNTIYTPRSYEPISFEELRRLAEAHDITRLAIETRKDQLEKLDWTIRARGDKPARPNTAARADRLAQFWRRPAGERPFATWLRELLEDLLVLDAPALELRRNRGGALIGLDVIDGATIKVLVDETGRRPRPPAPAYEQVIHGRPWKLLTADELLYLPRNPRPHKAYGFGPVEQIVMTVNVALRRQVMQLQHFTDGNVPPGLLNAPDGWNVEQISQFQEWFDSVLAGNTGNRSRLVWGPSGARYQAFKEAPYKRFRRMAGAHRLLRLLLAADRLHPPGQPRHRRDLAGGLARRGPGAADGLGQAARRPRDPGRDRRVRPRIRLGRPAPRRPGRAGQDHRHLCPRRHLRDQRSTRPVGPRPGPGRRPADDLRHPRRGAVGWRHIDEAVRFNF